ELLDEVVEAVLVNDSAVVTAFGDGITLQAGELRRAFAEGERLIRAFLCPAGTVVEVGLAEVNDCIDASKLERALDPQAEDTACLAPGTVGDRLYGRPEEKEVRLALF